MDQNAIEGLGHSQVENLRAAISALDAQRTVLGDLVVDTALAPLREKLVALQAASAPPPIDERRLVTILFTDIVESTALAEKLDPEEWRRVVAQLHSTVGDTIAEHHGQVAQYLGDGLIALFGAQASSEFDAENAVRAALAIQSQAGLTIQVHKRASPAPEACNLQLRIGIHTGLVVVGELGAEAHREFAATGDAMNLAARLQAAAPPGGVFISHDTYRYVRGVFDVTPQPPLTVKGKNEPVQTYLVRRAKARPFRAETRGVAGIETRTIGRARETTSLQDAYREAYENKQVVWTQLIGVTGVGKTRLLNDFDDWTELRPEEIRVLRARALPEDRRIPYALVRRLWFDRFQIAEDAPLAQAEAKWEQKFQELTCCGDIEPAHALGLLVGLPFRDSPYIGAMRNDPAQVHGRAFVVSRELVQTLRAQMPVKVLLEDLQLADEASWEWLSTILLGSQAEDGLNGMMIVGTARPDWQPPESLRGARQGPAAHYRTLEVEPLTDADTRELAHELLRSVDNVPEEAIQLIVERAEGIPYYAEEIVNWFLDRGIIEKTGEPWRFFPARLREAPLPTTLQHLLLTRLSALSDPERAALQRGSIFGRRFWTGGIQALGVREGKALLEHLQPRGFVHIQPESTLEGETEWSFAQTMLREVTYDSVLRRERARLHRQAAEWLQAQAAHAGRLDEFAGLLGEHYEHAGELLFAADWYLRAGEHAKKRGGTREARRFFERALELLPPIERERRWHALAGHQEAVELLGESDANRADLAAMVALGDELDDDNLRAEAHSRLAGFLYMGGDIPGSNEHSAVALEAARHAGNLRIELRGMAYQAMAWIREDQSAAGFELLAQALVRARNWGDARTLAHVLNTAATAHAEAGDFAKALPLLAEGNELARGSGNRMDEAAGLMNLGAAYLWLGMYKQARANIESALRIWESLGARSGIALGLLNLGEVHWFSGDSRTAHQLLEQALNACSELNWQRGRALALNELGIVMEQSGDVAGAARRHKDAREIAHAIQLAPIEFEACVGLARCALLQGDLEQARAYAVQAWDYMRVHGAASMEHPLRAFVVCADVLDALGDAPTARAVVEAGYHELRHRADRLSDPQYRQALLENEPYSRALIEMYERWSSVASASETRIE